MEMKVMTEELKYIDIDPTAAGKLAQKIHVKKEEIPFIRKSYLAEKQEGNAKERSVVSYISTGIKDRDNEALIPEGVKLENYRNNPVVMWGHDYSNLPVGKNLWIKTDEKGLLAKTVFAKSKRGEELFKAYTDDIDGTGPLLKGWSVGFIPVKWEDAEQKEDARKRDSTIPQRIFTEWELLEYSAVPIPSCPEALTLAVAKNLVPEFLKKDLEGKVFIESEDEKEFEGVTATWREGKDADYRVDENMNIIQEISIDEATKDVRHLLAVDEAHLKKAIISFAKKYGLNSDNLGRFSAGHLINDFEHKYNLKTSFNKEGDYVIAKVTKPETTDQYHRIPVNPGCEVTATITISASQGIKAIYCGKVKKVHTYLFDVNKWTMAEAKKWVEDHKGINDALCETIVGEHMKGLEMMAFEPEEKEGRVLSGQNRKLLSNVIGAIEDALPPLKNLLEATEPDEFTEREPEVEVKKEDTRKKELEVLGKQIDKALLKVIPKALEKLVEEKLNKEIKRFRGKVE